MIRGQPADWLKKNESHYLSDISHLEVGLCHQSLRMEFENPKASYNLLIRNQSCCDQFLQTLTCKNSAIGGMGEGFWKICSWRAIKRAIVGDMLEIYYLQAQKKTGGEPHSHHNFSASL